MARSKRLDPRLFRLQFVYVYSLCICLQSWICTSQHVASSDEAGVKHQNNISAGMYLHTSSDVTIRVGKQLQLNCTIAGAVNSSRMQLSWYRGNQELTNLTRKLSNETVQLVIDHVSWINNGTYMCRENNHSNRVHPESVLVTVGDVPGPPQDVWINSVEMRTYIHWKAPRHLGGLQLNYAVKGQCNDSFKLSEWWECKMDSFTLCEDIRPENEAESDRFKCPVSAILHQDEPNTSNPVTYVAFVEARNVLGSRKSDPVEFNIKLFDALSTTPQPDIFPSAKEVSPLGTVKLSWKDARHFMQPIEVEYTILYHKDGDRKNKSVTVNAPRTNVLISGLVGFSCYHFYLLVRYAKEGTDIYGIYSKATELTVKTKISGPRRPVIKNCSHWSDLNSDPGLTVTWTIPDAEYFNGPSKSAIIYYRCQRGRQDLSGNLTVTNSTVRSAVINAVTPSDACQVWIIWMKLCNKPGLCSTISNMCRTPAENLKDNTSPGPKDSRNSVLGTVMIILAGTAGGVVLVIIIVMCYRIRKNKGGNRRHPLRNVLIMPTVIHGYDEIEELQENNNDYDVINV